MAPAPPRSLRSHPVATAGLLLLTGGAAVVVAALGLASTGGARAGTASRVAEYVATPVLRGLAWLVVRNDALLRSDYLVVLNGRVDVRAGIGARLYARGVAPRILVAATRDRRPPRVEGGPSSVDELIIAQMREKGVPAAAMQSIPFPGGVVSTRDEARALRRFLLEHPARRITIATTDYHTGRARLIFRQELRGLGVDVRVAGASEPGGTTPDDWWRSRAGRRTYALEYLKWGCAMLRCR